MRKANNTRQARRKSGELEQKKQAEIVDELRVFEEFKESFLPLLRDAVRGGMPIEKIRKAFAPAVQAQMIQKALQGDFKAMKDTLDRFEGMAVQRVEQKTVIGSMDIDELRALVAQKANDVGLTKIIEAKFKQVKDDEETSSN